MITLEHLLGKLLQTMNWIESTTTLYKRWCYSKFKKKTISLNRRTCVYVIENLSLWYWHKNWIKNETEKTATCILNIHRWNSKCKLCAISIKLVFKRFNRRAIEYEFLLKLNTLKTFVVIFIVNAINYIITLYLMLNCDCF